MSILMDFIRDFDPLKPLTDQERKKISQKFSSMKIRERVIFMDKISKRIQLKLPFCKLESFTEKYQINYEKIIDSGSYSSVYQGTNKETHQKVVIKFFIPNLNIINSFKNHYSLKHHPNIIPLLDLYLNNTLNPNIQSSILDWTLIAIYPKINGLDLERYTRKYGAFKEKEAQRILWETIKGLEHIHKHNLVHCDLKLENIMLDYDSTPIKPIIIDMDSIISVGEHMINSDHHILGTLDYMHPELISYTIHYHLNKTSDQLLAIFEYDYWSLGVISYCLMSNDYPFEIFRKRNSYINCIMRFNNKIDIYDYDEVNNLFEGKFHNNFHYPVSKICIKFLNDIFQGVIQGYISIDLIQDHEWFRSKVNKRLHNLSNSLLDQKSFEKKDNLDIDKKNVSRKKIWFIV